MKSKFVKEFFKKGIAAFLVISMLTTVPSTTTYAAFDIKGAFQNMKDAASDVTNKAKSTASDVLDKTDIKEQATKMKDSATDTANKAKEALTEKASDAKEHIITSISKIDSSTYKNGWDIVSKYAGAKLAANESKEYVDEIQNAINNMRKDMNASASSNRTLASEAGFLAEKWHETTFNIDAKIKKTGETATLPKSNKFASPDIELSDGQSAGLKYYRNGTESAKAQAKSLMESYSEYSAKLQRKGEIPPTLEDYLDERVDCSQITNLYESIYEGQKLIIPSDQMDEAKTYLNKRIARDSSSNNEARLKVADGTKKTLDSLADRLDTKKGTQSKPLSYDEATAIAQLCQSGDFDPSDFGISVSQLISPKYILKQSIGAGITSATFDIVLTMGPDIYKLVVDSLQNKKVDEKELKKLGIDTAINGSEGFVEGAVSSAVLLACQTGKFGPALAKDISPDMVGTMTVLIIDCIKYGYQLSNKEITPEEYGNAVAEEVFVAAVSQTSGVALQTLLPMVPFAYLIGTMVGGMLATTGYEVGKEVILEVRGNSGFEVIMPEAVATGVDIGKDAIASLELDAKASDLKEFLVSTTKKGQIILKNK